MLVVLAACGTSSGASSSADDPGLPSGWSIARSEWGRADPAAKTVTLNVDTKYPNMKLTLFGKEQTSGPEKRVSIAVPFSALQVGKHDYPIDVWWKPGAADAPPQTDHVVLTYEFMPPASLTFAKPSLAGGKLTLTYFDKGAAAATEITSILDEAGNAAFDVTGPAGTTLSIGTTSYTFGAGPTRVTYPLLAAVVDQPFQQDVGNGYVTANVVAGSSTGTLTLEPGRMLSAVQERAFAGLPTPYPGETATAPAATPHSIHVHNRILGSATKLRELDAFAAGTVKTQKLSPCTYTGGFVVEREMQTEGWRVIDRRTGKTIATRTFSRPDAEACPAEIRVKKGEVGSSWLAAPDPATVDAWVSSLMK